MRRSAFIVSSALAAAACAAAISVSGCKTSATGVPLPNPSMAPTFPPGTVTEYPVPTANATPIGISRGLDGNLWFTELNGNAIGRATTAGAITEFPLPTASSGPVDITLGPTGNPNVWFDEFANNKVGYITTGAPNTITEFPLPTVGSGPLGLTPDNTRGVLWFGEFFGGNIDKITVGGIVTQYSARAVYPSAQPDAVVVAPDDSIWYLDEATNAVGHLTFSPSATFVEYTLPTAANNPQFIVIGGDGNLWLTELGHPGITGCRVARVTLSGLPVITEFAPPNQVAPEGDWCTGIAKGSDGNVWFAETDVGAIARIKPDGTLTEWGVPGSGTTAIGVTSGPDSNLWFTDGAIDPNLPIGFIGTNQIGKVVIGLLPASSVRKSVQLRMTTRPLRAIPVVHGVVPRVR